LGTNFRVNSSRKMWPKTQTKSLAKMSSFLKK
jgi:hypothetical protein